jgi:uncharacterized coiled-coil protein SlyX
MTSHRLLTAVTVAALGAGTILAGTAGTAGAAIPPAHVTLAAATSGKGNKCGPAVEKRLDRLEKRNTNLPKRISALDAAEAKAKAAGHTKRADRLELRITRLEKREPNVSNRIQKIETRCPTLTPSGSSAS